MTGVNLKTVHVINLIQNGGGERQEFRRSYRRSESSFGEMRAPLNERVHQQQLTVKSEASLLTEDVCDFTWRWSNPQPYPVTDLGGWGVRQRSRTPPYPLQKRRLVRFHFIITAYLKPKFLQRQGRISLLHQQFLKFIKKNRSPSPPLKMFEVLLTP